MWRGPVRGREQQWSEWLKSSILLESNRTPPEGGTDSHQNRVRTEEVGPADRDNQAGRSAASNLSDIGSLRSEMELKGHRVLSHYRWRKTRLTGFQLPAQGYEDRFEQRLNLVRQIKALYPTRVSVPPPPAPCTAVGSGLQLGLCGCDSKKAWIVHAQVGLMNLQQQSSLPNRVRDKTWRWPVLCPFSGKQLLQHHYWKKPRDFGKFEPPNFLGPLLIPIVLNQTLPQEGFGNVVPQASYPTLCWVFFKWDLLVLVSKISSFSSGVSKIIHPGKALSASYTQSALTVCCSYVLWGHSKHGISKY